MTDPNANSGMVGFVVISIIALRTCNPFIANILNVSDILTVSGVAH